jgi:hypothetical protein
VEHVIGGQQSSRGRQLLQGLEGHGPTPVARPCKVPARHNLSPGTSCCRLRSLPGGRNAGSGAGSRRCRCAADGLARTIRWALGVPIRRLRLVVGDVEGEASDGRLFRALGWLGGRLRGSGPIRRQQTSQDGFVPRGDRDLHALSAPRTGELVSRLLVGELIGVLAARATKRNHGRDPPRLDDGSRT